MQASVPPVQSRNLNCLQLYPHQLRLPAPEGHSSGPWVKSNWLKMQIQVRLFLFLSCTEVERQIGVGCCCY